MQYTRFHYSDVLGYTFMQQLVAIALIGTISASSRMISPKPGEERSGDMMISEGVYTVEVRSAGQCTYQMREPLSGFDDLESLNRDRAIRRRLTGLDSVMPDGLCVDVGADIHRPYHQYRGWAEAIEYQNDRIRCRRPGDSRTVYYDFPGKPLSKRFNEIQEAFDVHDKRIAGSKLERLLTFTKSEDFELDLEGERLKLEFILDGVCGFILQTVWPMISAAISPQFSLMYADVEKQLVPLRAERIANQTAERERLQTIRIAELEKLRGEAAEVN